MRATNMYVPSTHAKEVNFGTFVRSLVLAVGPPDRSVKKRLSAHFGDHVICLNNETALSLLFRSIPGREPGMVVAIDSILLKQSRRVVEASGFKTFVFDGEKQLLETLKSVKVDVLYISDHFNQGGRKVHRSIKEFGGLVVVMQHRQKYRVLKDVRADVMLWRPKGLTRSSGGVVMIFRGSAVELARSVRTKIKHQDTLSKWEVVCDIYYGLFNKVQASRHIAKRPPLLVRQLIEHRLKGDS